MGARNALDAYKLYAGKVPPTALNVLVYMALVALDRDGAPSWWEGHEILAIRCFARSEPITKSDLRAVERAITPLFDVGAITVARHSSGNPGKTITVRYRLWLVTPAPDEKRRVGNERTRRKVVPHPTKSGSAPDEKRRTKEYEETRGARSTKVLDLDGSVEGGLAPAVAPVDNHDSAASNNPEAERARQHAALEEWKLQHPEAVIVNSAGLRREIIMLGDGRARVFGTEADFREAARLLEQTAS
jgi:hypothetical protein